MFTTLYCELCVTNFDSCISGLRGEGDHGLSATSVEHKARARKQNSAVER